SRGNCRLRRRDQFGMIGKFRGNLPMSDHLIVESSGGVVRLTLNRPERRNALSHALLGDLEHAITSIAADKTPRLVILGAPGSVFCSGHGLAEMGGEGEADYRNLFER